MIVALITTHDVKGDDAADALVMTGITYGYSTALALHSPNTYNHLANAYGTPSGLLTPKDEEYPVFFLHDILDGKCTQPLYLHVVEIELIPEFRADPFLVRLVENLQDVAVLQGETLTAHAAGKVQALIDVLTDEEICAADVEEFLGGCAEFAYTPHTASRRALLRGLGLQADTAALTLYFDGSETPYALPHLTLPLGTDNPIVRVVMDTRQFIM